ncbi:hypothetical protein JXL83_01600 [candidate division WOR-3 bacterium]|nr:hypothetical protein [candidate division WOR-3 bacterium]
MIHRIFLALLSSILILSNCFPVTKNPEKEISDLIFRKTGMKIDTTIEIVEDSVTYTEGAFDSDYTRNLILSYENGSENEIISWIENSKYYDQVLNANYAEPMWKKIDEDGLPGVWVSRNYGYEFFHSMSQQAEPFTLRVDTIKNFIKMELRHL